MRHVQPYRSPVPAVRGRRRVSRARVEALSHPPIRPANAVPVEELPAAFIDVVARFDALGPGALRRLARAMARSETELGPVILPAYESLDDAGRAALETTLMLTAESYRRRFPGPRPPGRLRPGSPRAIAADATSAPELWCLGYLVAARLPREAAILQGPWHSAADGRPFAGPISAM
jgi:hypothetical protein